MKKIILAAIASIIAIAPMGAQTKQELKAAKKEAKTTAKQMKRNGYSLLELGDMTSQFQNFIAKTKTGCQQIVGTAENCMTINLAKTTALNNAVNEYATMAGGEVKGRITTNASSVGGAQIDDIVAAYERLVQKEIKGEIRSCMTLVKQKKNAYDVKVYCLIDFDAAHAAKMKAMALALEELKLSQEYGSKISDWVNAGFNK